MRVWRQNLDAERLNIRVGTQNMQVLGQNVRAAGQKPAGGPLRISGSANPRVHNFYDRAAPAWTLMMAPRMEASGERCDIDNAKLGRSPRAGTLKSIAGTGGMASKCVRLVSFIRSR